jgi:oligoribonuclease NrnB/cAMP/cGMP phosphodiesterase (DHH superfamily)
VTNLLITHNDMDGSCCALVFAEMRLPKPQILICDNPEVEEKAKSVFEAWEQDPALYDRVIVADVLPPRKFLEPWLKHFKGKLTAVDHHQGNDYLNEYVGCAHTVNACAGLIMANRLRDTSEAARKCREFAHVVDAYDRWQEKSEFFCLAGKLDKLHALLGQKAFIRRGPEIEFTDSEQFAITCAERQAWEQVAKLITTTPVLEDSEGRKFLFAVNIFPPVAHPVLMAKPEAEYILVWHQTRGAVSLYGREGGLDVSVLAKQHGGGGHKAAAGFPVGQDVYQGIIEALVTK